MSLKGYFWLMLFLNFEGYHLLLYFCIFLFVIPGN